MKPENYTPTTSNEELCARIRNGDSSAINTLWEQTYKLFHMIARTLYIRHRERAASCGVEADDCYQVTWFAFVDALETYNREPERETKFTSFARLHVCRHIFALLGMRTSKRESLNEADSLTAPIRAVEGDITIADTIVDKEAELPFEDIVNADVAREVLKCVDNALSEKQSGIIRRHFFEGMSIPEIALADRLKPKRVHNICRETLRKLRRDERLQQIHQEFYANANLTKNVGFRFFKENQMSSVEWHLLRLEELLERVNGTKGGDADL